MLSWGGRGDSARLGGRPARWLYTGRVSRMSRRPPLLHTEWGSQAKPHLGSLLPPKPLSPGPPHPTHRPHAVCSCHLPAHLGGLELQGGGSGRLQPGGPRGQGRASPPWSSPLQAGQKEGEGGKEGGEGSRTLASGLLRRPLPHLYPHPRLTLRGPERNQLYLFPNSNKTRSI